MKFSDLQLHPKLQANLDKIKFSECTPVQEQAIPWLRKGKDLSGLAQTGTGKTGAFLIPLIDRILKSIAPDPTVADTETIPFPDWKRKHFILVLVPTRELAEQVQENAKSFVENTGLNSVSIYGGTTYEKQIQGLKEGCEIVIATPGRFIDLYKEHMADLGLVRAVVFDEADRMFDMGFKDDMTFLLKRMPRERQFLVFSATLNFEVLNTAYEYGAEPVEINISRDQAKAENVQDMILHVGQEDKPKTLATLIKKFEPQQAIIFSNFKHSVERIAQFLSDNGVPAVGISSLLTQGQRNRVMALFKAENDRNILVATDVAARGLDIRGVDMVINFDLPDDAENYVHRIGRTGRAGATGKAFSMVGDRDVDALQRIEDYLGHKVEVLWLDDSDYIKDLKPFPREDRRPPRHASSGGGSGGGGRGPRPPRAGGSSPGGGGPRERHRDRSRGRGGEVNESGERPPRFAAGEGASPNGDGPPRGRGGPRRPPRRDGDMPARGGGDRPPREPREGERGRRPQAQQGGRGAAPARANGGAPSAGGAPRGRGPQDGRRPSANGGRSANFRPRPQAGAARPGAGAPVSAAGPGLGKKVTGFIKRLFGK